MSRAPTATYRLQLPGLGLARARELVGYLHALGVSDLYASPVLQAREGSAHGYDVVDPTRLDPALGTEAELDALADALRRNGMGLVLDVVPNHMAASPENPWWWDVLEHGPASPYAGYFDIDWSAEEDGDGAPRLLRPVLGDHYGYVLERGELRLGIDERGLRLAYFDRPVPLDPRSYAPVLGLAAELEGAAAAALTELADAFGALPDRMAGGPAAERRRREAEALKRRLWALYRDRDEVRSAVDAALERLNGRPGEPASFDALDRLVLAQPYRLSYWQLATRELNYRRFFDIADLVGVRVEEPQVFEASHARVLRWVREGKVTGVRVDHVDGLLDPTGYLVRLRAALDERGPPPASNLAPSAGRIHSPSGRPCLLVEKILAPDEALPAEWPVDGTTGYEFADALNRLLADPAGLRSLDRLYRRETGVACGFDDLVRRKKKQVMARLFVGETEALGGELRRLARADRHARDIPSARLEQALVETTACLDVYRTYVRSPDVAPRDAERIERALAGAQAWLQRGGDAAALHFLRRVLLLERSESTTPEQLEARLGFVERWQQFTGPVMAKGLEDCALYVHARLLSMNEVGGAPGEGALAPEAFHARMAERAALRPGSLSATSTHDTKRSEDVRARIGVLSEMAGDWRRHWSRWRRWNGALRERVHGRTAPDANEEWLVYQTLLGAWPLDEAELAGLGDRVEAYLQKALREARVHSDWIRIDEAYEGAVQRFARRLLEDERFLGDFLPLQRRVALHGAVRSLAQVVLKATAPGVPDLYQGAELWDFSLVDPDNRRPVDFALRARLLAELDAGADPDDLRERWRDGRIKLWTTARLLRLRRERPALFGEGRYLPLAVSGRRRRGVVAFAREREGEWAVAAVPVRSVGVAEGESLPRGDAWRLTTAALPEGAPRRWRCALTGRDVVARGGRLRLDDLFGPLPYGVATARAS